jgi:hypothetical protein
MGGATRTKRRNGSLASLNPRSSEVSSAWSVRCDARIVAGPPIECAMTPCSGAPSGLTASTVASIAEAKSGSDDR